MPALWHVHLCQALTCLSLVRVTFRVACMVLMELPHERLYEVESSCATVQLSEHHPSKQSAWKSVLVHLLATSHGMLHDRLHAFAPTEHCCRAPPRGQAGSQTLPAAMLHEPIQYGTHGASGAPAAKESGQNLAQAMRLRGSCYSRKTPTVCVFSKLKPGLHAPPRPLAASFAQLRHRALCCLIASPLCRSTKAFSCTQRGARHPCNAGCANLATKTFWPNYPSVCPWSVTGQHPRQRMGQPCDGPRHISLTRRLHTPAAAGSRTHALTSPYMPSITSPAFSRSTILPPTSAPHTCLLMPPHVGHKSSSPSERSDM